MKNTFSLLFITCLLLLQACKIDEQFDPNQPSLTTVLNDATQVELNLLVSGIEATTRTSYGGYITALGSIAREMYLFDADPRNTDDLLGKDGASLDNNTFYLTGPYNTRYRVIKTCNILLEALDNTSSVDENTKNGYRGFANTIKGLMYLQVLDMLDENGLRFDVADPTNLGPFISKSEAFTAIRNLLNTASEQLGGATFAFVLSDGFDGFNTPPTFNSFNRAIAARTATHQKDYAAALSLVNNSFLDLNGDLAVGPKHSFSLTSGDILNPVFRAPDQNGDQIIVHNLIILEAEAGDTRLNKFAERIDPTSQDGLNGTHESRLYASTTSPIDIIRNEELVLIYAEASIQENQLGNAETALNVIRNAAGLDDLPAGMTKDELIDEMLKQRKYSLWGEGHRFQDMRRYDRLNDMFLPIDRPGDIIHTQFPIPLTEG